MTRTIGRGLLLAARLCPADALRDFGTDELFDIRRELTDG
jgi:hypothetical protein